MSDECDLVSPIEEIVAWALPKYLEPAVEIVREHPVRYGGTEFRLDFLLRRSSGLYGLECDGKEFHRSFRDSFRDACILGVSDVVAIYRITGRDIHATLREFVVMKLDRSEGDQYWHELFTFARRLPHSTMDQIADKYVNRSNVG